MHNIGTPELPEHVLLNRNQFMEEQRLAQQHAIEAQAIKMQQRTQA